MQQKPQDYSAMEAVAPISVPQPCKPEPMEIIITSEPTPVGAAGDIQQTSSVKSVDSNHEPDSNYEPLRPLHSVQSDAGSENLEGQKTSTQSSHNTRVDRIRDGLENAIEDDAKARIEDILDSVRQLSDVEKLLLYLKLPTGTRSKDLPPQTPSSSLHLSNLEHAQAFTWIQSHLEEDNETCLRKDEVYDDYKMYCETNSMKPLNTADFGKVMKRAFPNVKPRRLGQRGQSKYCYSGLRKKVELQPPSLPDLGETCEPVADTQKNGDEELMPECIALVCEWAENLLGRGFNNVRELAEHLLSNLYVNSKSTAAFALTAAMQKPAPGNGSKLPVSSLFASQGSGRGAQVQLQRRIKERELLRETKSKIAAQREETTAATIIKQEPPAVVGGNNNNNNHRRRSIKTKLFSPPIGTCNAVQPTQSSAISSTAPSAHQIQGRPMPFMPPQHHHPQHHPMGGMMPMHIDGAQFDPMAWRQPPQSFPMTPGMQPSTPGLPGTPFGTPGTPFGNPLLDPPTPFKNIPPPGADHPGMPYPVMHPRSINLDPSPRSAFIPVTTNSPAPHGAAPSKMSKPEHPRLESILKGELQTHMSYAPPEYLTNQLAPPGQMAPPMMQQQAGRGGSQQQQLHQESVLQTPTKLTSEAGGGLMVPQLNIPQIQPSPTKRKLTPIKPKCPTGKTVSTMLKEARGFGPDVVDPMNSPFLTDMRPVSAILKETREQRHPLPLTPTSMQKFAFENFNANMKRPRRAGGGGSEPQSASKRQIQESHDQPGTPKCVDVYPQMNTSNSRLSIDDLSISSLENDSLLEFLNSGANPLDPNDGVLNTSGGRGGRFIPPSGIPQQTTPHYQQLELLDPPTPFKNPNMRPPPGGGQQSLPMSPLVVGGPPAPSPFANVPPPNSSADMYMSHAASPRQPPSPQRRRPSFGEYYEQTYQGRPPPTQQTQHVKKKDSKKLPISSAAGSQQSKQFINYAQSQQPSPASAHGLSPEQTAGSEPSPQPRPPSHHQVSPQDAASNLPKSTASSVTMTTSGNRYAPERGWAAMNPPQQTISTSERGLPPPPSYRRISGGAPYQMGDMMLHPPPQSPNIYPPSEQPNYWTNLPTYRHMTPSSAVTSQPASLPGQQSRSVHRGPKLSPGRAVKVSPSTAGGAASANSSGLNVSDELQSTLDVLRDFDTQYFNQSGDVDSGDDPSLRQHQQAEFPGMFVGGNAPAGGASNTRRSTSDQNQVVPPEGALTPDSDVFIVENLTSNKYSRTVTTR